MIKIETHLHTGGTSHCAITEPEKIAELYAQSGYGAIIVTDHYMKHFFDRFGEVSQKSKIYNFLKGFRATQERGHELGLKVWLGCEVNLDIYNENHMPSCEFLIYGERVEQLLYDCPQLNALTQQQLFEKCNEYGILMLQAHPFREYAVRANPAFMHGAEVYNANPRHINNNGLAAEFAREYGLLPISGSDFHIVGDEGRGGVIMESCNSMSEFVDNLKNKKYELIK